MKKDNSYYRIFETMVEGSLAAGQLLDEIMRNYDPSTLSIRIKEMHKIEHSNDEIIYETIKKLIKEFLPPLDREDISLLLEALDDPLDAIEDVLFGLYMYNVNEIKEEALEFSKLILEALDVLYDVTVEFKNFKIENQIKEKIIKINDIESEGDVLNIDVMRKLYTEEESEKNILVWTRLFERLENCLDKIEDAANIMESIMMKNI